MTGAAYRRWGTADRPGEGGRPAPKTQRRPVPNPQHPAQAPTFRKRSGGLSIPFPGQAVQVRKRSREWAEVRLPKLGSLRFRLSRPLGGMVRNATIAKDALGWHVSFGLATATKPAPPNRLPGCGVDFGVACSAFVSDEREPRLMPSTLTAGQRRRLLGLERRKARQIAWARKHNSGRYSNRLARTISQIAKLRARQARRRQDFTHKLTTDLAKNHGWVAIEDLRAKGMTKSAGGTRERPGRNVRAKAGLNRAILDNAPSSGSASSHTRHPSSGRSCGSYGQRSRVRRARRAGSVTPIRGRYAAGCSCAPPAAISSMRT
jgi:putative transposase